MKLDVSVFSNDIKFVFIGKLSEEMVEFLLEKKPSFI